MERRQDIDIYRGLGILLVVLGHVSYLSPYWHKVIYSFHMPAFFILSGYLFSVKNIEIDFSLFIKHRFFRLVYPAWAIGLICGLPYVAMLLSNNLPFDNFITKLYGTLTGATKVENNFFVTPIWFLYCLFILEGIFYLIKKLIKKDCILAVTALFLFLLGKEIEVVDIFNINIALISMPYFVLGYLLRGITIPRAKMLALFSVITLLYMPFINPGYVDFSAMQIGHGVWVFFNSITALLGTYLLYFISGYIRSDKIAWLGTNTVIILGFNYYVNAIIKIILKTIHMENIVLLSFSLQVILFYFLIKIISCSPNLYSIINGKHLTANKLTK